MANENIKDFFNKDFARGTVGTLIGALVAFMAYVFYKRWETEKEGQRISIRERRRLDYISSLVRRSFEQVKQTTLEIQNAIESIDRSPMHLYDLKLPANTALERLQEVLEKEEYHDAYLNVLGETESESYHQLVSTTEFLLNQRKMLETLNGTAIAEDTRRKSEYVSMVYELLKRGMELVQRPGLLDEEEIVVINRIYDAYYESFTEYTDIDYHQLRFVLPMLEEALDPFTDRMPVLELATAFKSVRNLYEDIRVRNVSFRKELFALVSTYQSNELLFESGLQDLMDRRKAAQAEDKNEPAQGKGKERKRRKGADRSKETAAQ